MMMMLKTNRRMSSNCICLSSAILLLLSVSTVVAFQGQGNDLSFSSFKSHLAANIIVDPEKYNNNNDGFTVHVDGFVKAWNNLVKLKPLPVRETKKVTPVTISRFSSSSMLEPLKITRPRGFVEVKLVNWMTSISTTVHQATLVLDVSTTSVGEQVLSGHHQPEVVTTPDPSLRQRKLAFRKLKNNMKKTVIPGFTPKNDLELQLEVDQSLRLQLQSELQTSQEKQSQEQQQASNPEDLLSPPSIFQAWQEATTQQCQALTTSAALQMQTFTESIKSKIGNLGGIETVVPPPEEDQDDTSRATAILSIQSMKDSQHFRALETSAALHMQTFTESIKGKLGNLAPVETVASSPPPPEDDDSNDAPRTTAVWRIQSMKDSILSIFGNSGLTSEPQENESSPPPPPPEDDDDDKFSVAQRIESVKCVVAGALGGGVAVTPVAYLHSAMVSSNALAQWELWTDMASLQAALFAIVYRYAVRDDDNPMLNQGVIGAFVLARTLSAIQVSETCTAVPLICK